MLCDRLPALARFRAWPCAYDLRIHHDDIVAPLLRQWGVWELEGLDADGEAARDELAAAVAALDSEATRFVERRDEAAAKKAARQA